MDGRRSHRRRSRQRCQVGGLMCHFRSCAGLAKRFACWHGSGRQGFSWGTPPQEAHRASFLTLVANSPVASCHHLLWSRSSCFATSPPKHQLPRPSAPGCEFEQLKLRRPRREAQLRDEELPGNSPPVSVAQAAPYRLGGWNDDGLATNRVAGCIPTRSVGTSRGPRGSVASPVLRSIPPTARYAVHAASRAWARSPPGNSPGRGFPGNSSGDTPRRDRRSGAAPAR
jgi:hypothetical protein